MMQCLSVTIMGKRGTEEDCLSNEGRTAFALASFFSQITVLFSVIAWWPCIFLWFSFMCHTHNSEVKARKGLEVKSSFSNKKKLFLLIVFSLSHRLELKGYCRFAQISIKGFVLYYFSWIGSGDTDSVWVWALRALSSSEDRLTLCLYIFSTSLLLDLWKLRGSGNILVCISERDWTLAIT